jgi:hypothetical protein
MNEPQTDALSNDEYIADDRAHVRIEGAELQFRNRGMVS